MYGVVFLEDGFEARGRAGGGWGELGFEGRSCGIDGPEGGRFEDWGSVCVCICIYRERGRRGKGRIRERLVWRWVRWWRICLAEVLQGCNKWMRWVSVGRQACIFLYAGVCV